ncbi:hypothetical protein ACIPY5_17535 [Microbacterium sp. NPDC089698]|uniref:hypothetical protein n=1 Tax=unclassified Microbacterium TaxID=2609290 RepID=UPI00282B9A34|nr:hypothetical protein [Microbacterium sp.]MDR2322303.1 hypothetical protein [Microbacterium sp.]
MGADYGVDTDQLRAMASKTVRIAEDFGSTDLPRPAALHHAEITEAVRCFTEKWGIGLQTRVGELNDFADKLKTTARIFDEGQDAGKHEMDSLIWDS